MVWSTRFPNYYLTYTTGMHTNKKTSPGFLPTVTATCDIATDPCGDRYPTKFLGRYRSRRINPFEKFGAPFDSEWLGVVGYFYKKTPF